jgi:hypothetical protein
MLGVPAVRREGTSPGVCAVWTLFGPNTGDRAMSVVADVQGTIYMVVACGPAAGWSQLSQEFDAMVASLTLDSAG